MSKKKSVIIVAGGKGLRMKSELPKQFIELSGMPILMHTISKFHSYDDDMKLVVVLPEEQIEFWNELCQRHSFNIPHIVVKGGSERFHSVRNGLKMISESNLVAIHDGVRPLVSSETIDRCFAEAERSGTAIPVVSLNDSIREITADGNETRSRNNYRLVQTPQIFKTKLIKNAYDQEFSTTFTDDASVVEAAGNKISLIEGNIENIKITTAADLHWAALYLTDVF